MNSTPPPLAPPPIPANSTLPSGGGLSRPVLFGLIAGSMCLVIVNAVAAILRLRARVGNRAVSYEWYGYVVGYVAAGIIVPLVIAGVVSAIARRNKSGCFVISFFAVVAVMTLSQIPRALKSSRLPTASLTAPTHAFGAQVFRNDFPLFSIELPKGFVEHPAGTKSPGIIGVFVLKEGPEAQAKATLYFKKMGGMLSPNVTVNRQRLRETMSPGTELTTKKWRGLAVDTCISRPVANGGQFSAVQIRIPLKPEAIEIALLGPVADEGALSAIADRLLESLEGETNW